MPVCKLLTRAQPVWQLKPVMSYRMQFYSRPGTPAARMTKVSTRIVCSYRQESSAPKHVPDSSLQRCKEAESRTLFHTSAVSALKVVYAIAVRQGERMTLTNFLLIRLCRCQVRLSRRAAGNSPRSSTRSTTATTPWWAACSASRSWTSPPMAPASSATHPATHRWDAHVYVYVSYLKNAVQRVTIVDVAADGTSLVGPTSSYAQVRRTYIYVSLLRKKACSLQSAEVAVESALMPLKGACYSAAESLHSPCT